MIVECKTLTNPNMVVDVVTSKTGNIITNIWDHTQYYLVSEPHLKNYITNFAKAHTRKQFQNWCAWDYIKNLNKTQYAEPIFSYEMDKFRKTVLVPKKCVEDALLPAWLQCVSVGSATVANAGNTNAPVVEEVQKKDMVPVVKKWIQLFSEFQFTPQVRFLNALGNCKSVSEVKSYILGYFSLTNNSYQNDLAEKVKSQEFETLAMETIGQTQNVINERLEIYYGEPGSGKTTTAIKENPGSEVVLCHPALDPDELFRGFDFKDGKPVFKPCPLKEAMLCGKVVILDEINLLNEDCRRTLQAVTDTKESVVINNETIHIKKGFKIIGTMNLKIDEQIFGLPAPLVDRAAKIKMFTMTATQLAKLAF